MKILSRYVFREILASSFLATALRPLSFSCSVAPLFEFLVRSGDGRGFSSSASGRCRP